MCAVLAHKLTIQLECLLCALCIKRSIRGKELENMTDKWNGACVRLKCLPATGAKSSETLSQAQFWCQIPAEAKAKSRVKGRRWYQVHFRDTVSLHGCFSLRLTQTWIPFESQKWPHTWWIAQSTYSSDIKGISLTDHNTLFEAIQVFFFCCGSTTCGRASVKKHVCNDLKKSNLETLSSRGAYYPLPFTFWTGSPLCCGQLFH